MFLCGSKKEKLADLKDTKLKIELGLCIMASYTKHPDEIKALHGQILENESGMEKFGEQIGIKMLEVCPETLLSLAGELEFDEETAVKTNSTIEGKIVEIKIEQFATIVVKDKNGRVHNFLFLNYFDTASLFTNDEIRKNDFISVNYSESEIYDPKNKEFRYYKIITGLEKIKKCTYHLKHYPKNLAFGYTNPIASFLIPKSLKSKMI